VIASPSDSRAARVESPQREGPGARDKVRRARGGLLALAAVVMVTAAIVAGYGLRPVAQQTLFGLVTASYLAPAAVSLTLIYGIMRLANFAHGDMLMLGAYIAYFVNVSLGASLVVGVVAAILIVGIVGLSFELALFRRARRRNADLLETLLITLALAFVLRYGVQFVAGNNPVSLDVDTVSSVHFLGLRLAVVQVVVLAAGAAVALGVGAALKGSRFGRQLRAMADDVSLTSLSGVDTDRRIKQLWLLAGALTSLAGVMLTAATGAMTPSLGFSVLLSLFAIAVLGGIGNPYGALAAAVILGVVQEWSVLVVDFRWKPLVAFAVLLLVLLVRPAGIFGTRITR
jgi:branched-subunit amino acid ABC-type transport system permease component